MWTLLSHNDLAQGYGAVHLPYALARKYPQVDHEWVWRFVFPAKHRAIDPRDGEIKRHHVEGKVLQ
ncbi:hypothetical protein [Aphanocapsa montana]|uniref:hypothetical protein n=1 Tax=Lyngbya confervoides TaxID=207921 RepID=UPI00140D4818